MSSKAIDVSNMGLISHSYQKLSQGDHIVIRIGKEYFHGRYVDCSETITSLRALSQDAKFKFIKLPHSRVTGKLSLPTNSNGCRHIYDEATGKRINIFVERVGKFASLRPYCEWKRNLLEKPAEPEIEDTFKEVHEDVPEIIRDAMKLPSHSEDAEKLLLKQGVKSSVIPFTKLPMNVLEVIAQCKLSGNLPELIRVAKEVQNGNQKLGITVSIEL